MNHNFEQKLDPIYYFNWHGLENFDYDFDDNGIPKVNYSGKIGLRYNAITTAQYGLSRLQRYTDTNEEKDLLAAIRCADWLVENLQEHRSGHAWVYDFDLDFYGPKAPWISGMAQGEGISLLLRIQQIDHKKQYSNSAKLAFSPFLKKVPDGGVQTNLPDGTIIFEEFPNDPPSHVLNGHIFALLGIFDYAQFFCNSEAMEIFNEACDGLLKNLNRWDTGYWCRYDLHPTRRLASKMYMKVHVQLLEILYGLTKAFEFRNTANRWRKHLENPLLNALWFGSKVIEKIRLLTYKRD